MKNDVEKNDNAIAGDAGYDEATATAATVNSAGEVNGTAGASPLQLPTAAKVVAC